MSDLWAPRPLYWQSKGLWDSTSGTFCIQRHFSEEPRRPRRPSPSARVHRGRSPPPSSPPSPLITPSVPAEKLHPHFPPSLTWGRQDGCRCSPGTNTNRTELGEASIYLWPQRYLISHPAQCRWGELAGAVWLPDLQAPPMATVTPGPSSSSGLQMKIGITGAPTFKAEMRAGLSLRRRSLLNHSRTGAAAEGARGRPTTCWAAHLRLCRLFFGCFCFSDWSTSPASITWWPDSQEADRASPVQVSALCSGSTAIRGEQTLGEGPVWGELFLVLLSASAGWIWFFLCVWGSEVGQTEPLSFRLPPGCFSWGSWMVADGS